MPRLYGIGSARSVFLSLGSTIVSGTRIWRTIPRNYTTSSFTHQKQRQPQKQSDAILLVLWQGRRRQRVLRQVWVQDCHSAVSTNQGLLVFLWVHLREWLVRSSLDQLQTARGFCREPKSEARPRDRLFNVVMPAVVESLTREWFTREWWMLKCEECDRFKSYVFESVAYEYAEHHNREFHTPKTKSATKTE